MTRRATTIQGVLAGVGLLLAYLTWQRAPELDTGEVFVLDVTKTDVQSIRFEDQGVWSELTPASDDSGFYARVRLSGSDPGDVALPSGHPVVQMKYPERLVRGNEAAKRLFERFAPLKASRALGQLDADTMKELGLDTTKKRIVVTVRGVKRTFTIAPAPPGGSDPYLRAEDDGRVYVVARTILTDLESAKTNLLERKLHGFALQDFDRLTIAGPAAGANAGKKREFNARKVEGVYGVQITPVDAPDKPDTTVENWHERVFNMFPAEVLGEGETPEGGAPVVALRVEYGSRGRPLGWLEIARSGQSGGGGDLYARSEHTTGWFKLRPEAAQLLTDGENLLSK